MYIPGLIAHLCDPGSLEAEQEDLHGQPELHKETEEMIQRLEVLTAFPENLSSDPAPTWGSWFSPSTVWVLGIQLTLSCLAGSTLTFLNHVHSWKRQWWCWLTFCIPARSSDWREETAGSVSVSPALVYFLSVLLLLVNVSHLTFVDHPSWKQCETRISGSLTCFCWRKEIQEGGAEWLLIEGCRLTFLSHPPVPK